MKKRERFKRVISFFEGFVILAIHVALFAYVWYGFYVQQLKIPFFRRGDWAVIGMYGLILFLLTNLYGGFKIGYLRLMDVLYSQILSLVSANIVAYVQVVLISRKYLSSAPIVKMTLVQLICILLWVLICKLIYAALYPPRQMLLVCYDRDPDDMILKMSSRQDKYEICDIADLNEEPLDAVCDMVKDYEAVLIYDIPAYERNIILKRCFMECVRTYVTPKISDILLRGADNIHIFDTPLYLSRNKGLSGDQIIFKRLLDLIISIPIAVVFMPLFIIISLLIKIYDGGPILYKQPRLTIDGKVFNIYKFRSMRIDSEKDGAQLAKKNDDRVTPVGKVLRACHFDEFPQLINIIKGDMSLVGPRPERPEIAKQYQQIIPEFDFRLKVKAGLTGYAQVYGKYNTTPYDKLKLDLTYIENYSIWLDVKLILLTFKILFQKDNTEGIDPSQITAIKSKKE
ncbi:MAG: exopolysaccharide biosynthesis polyprenyl glycosylphosphotransferase [Lachnospiraceae bacterium]|jgi:exopolysaccharide biosynthesis polyprenyl glycosylphosphotransferase|nr:exopolysaccharide biosynthesis polyprenyl glycosylphosphotransferase [Lachnospiraceae bacterium]